MKDSETDFLMPLFSVEVVRCDVSAVAAEALVVGEGAWNVMGRLYAMALEGILVTMRDTLPRSVQEAVVHRAILVLPESTLHRLLRGVDPKVVVAVVGPEEALCVASHGCTPSTVDPNLSFLDDYVMSRFVTAPPMVAPPEQQKLSEMFADNGDEVVYRRVEYTTHVVLEPG